MRNNHQWEVTERNKFDNPVAWKCKCGTVRTSHREPPNNFLSYKYRSPGDTVPVHRAPNCRYPRVYKPATLFDKLQTVAA